MESELSLLLGTVIDSLAKLEALLDLQARLGAVQTVKEIAGRLRRSTDEVTRALDELSEAGLIERFALGSGRHVVYGSTEDAHIQELLGLLHARYTRDRESRAELVREAMGGSERRQPGPSPSSAS